MTEALNKPAIEEIDGYLVDTTTGEILGIVGEKHAFSVSDMESAEWVLSKMLQAESRIASIETSEAVIHAKAIVANAERMALDHARKLQWLRARFEPELKAFAEKELAGSKSRTLKTLYGSISLRSVPGRLAIADEEKALQWALTFQPSAVKTTRKLMISALDPSDPFREYSDEALNTALNKGYLEMKPPSVAMTIKTGVEK